MKIIKTNPGVTIEAFDGPSAPITPELVNKIMSPALENKLYIITIANEIERIINDIISFYFFERHEITKEGKNKFVALVLNSDWCTFSSKRKLLNHIINEQELLKGKSKNEYENILRKTMSYRNAFTHGQLSTDGRTVKLSYFEGSPKTQFLTDEYLSKIEETVNMCQQTTIDISYSSGARVFKGIIEKNKS